MDWTVLNLEPTKDKKAITAAYRQKLLSVNPEDKPEEFKRLRAAYEEALKFADQTEEENSVPKTDVDLWMDQVRAVYNSFQERIDPEKWKKLLAEDVCIGLDTRPKVEEALLRFFMEAYYVPQSVWQVLDEAFSFSLRSKELYETYSKDFVDYVVLNGIRMKASLPYDLFIPGKSAKDCDEFRRLYYQAIRTATADREGILEQMALLPEKHPYGDALKYQFLLENGQKEMAREGLRRLAETYPGDSLLTLEWAAQCIDCGDWEAGEFLTRRVLDKEPDHQRAKRMLADCLAGLGRHEDAKTLIFDLMHASGGDQKALYQLNQVVQDLNKVIIETGEARLQEAPEDTDNAIKLAWCYLQNARENDAIKISQSIDPAYGDQYEYHHIYAKSCFAVRDYECAREHLQTVIEMLRTMKPDGTEETEKRMRRLPDMLQMEGSCDMLLGDKDKALAKYEEALALAPEDAELHTQMAFLRNSLKDYDGAVRALEKVIELMPNSYHGYHLMAHNLFEMGRDRDAFEAINRALELERGDLSVYVLKMRILLRNGVWGGVREILSFLRQNGITDEISVKWCDAQLVELQDKNKNQALKLYQELAARLENGEYLPWAAEVYYRITVLLAGEKNVQKPEDRAELLAVLEKGLAQDAEDFDCLDYKAWLLKRDGQFDEALKIYLELEKRPRKNYEIEREIAEIYYRNLERQAGKALQYYRILTTHNESPDFHFYAGTCCRYLGDYAGAERSFLREQELAPDDIDGFNGLAFVYEALGRPEEALAQVNQAIELVQGRGRSYTWLYSHKVQILRRMGKMQEAIEAVEQAMKKYSDFTDGYQLRFEICCQFGAWEQAQKMLEDWKQNEEMSSAMLMAGINLHLFQNNLLKAAIEAGKAKRKLDAQDEEEIRLQLAALEGNTRRQIGIWVERVKKREESGSDLTRALLSLAEAQWRSAGNRVHAVKNAQSALDRLDRILQGNLTNEALYRGRRAVALALLGREAEARAELERVRKLPLCQNCEYCRCKDAESYEATVEEIFGNERKALALYRAGKQNWPDELDFAAGENRLKGKVKKL